MFQCKLHLYSLSIRSQIPDRMTSFLGTNQFMVHVRYARTPADLVTPHQTGVTLRRRPNQCDFWRATFNLQIGDRTQDLEICWNDFLSENLIQDSSLVHTIFVVEIQLKVQPIGIRTTTVDSWGRNGETVRLTRL